MRLLIATHHPGLLGGVETYLAALMPALVARGCDIVFAHEEKLAASDPAIPLPPKTESINLREDFLSKLRHAAPQLAYIHAIDRLEPYEAIAASFPTIAFSHGYNGLCVSGTKTWKRLAHSCPKPFDWRCLLHYFPKSCGGSSPITMLRDYRRQSRLLDLLRRCDAVVTHPGPMEREYLYQGIQRDHLFMLPHFVPAPEIPAPSARGAQINIIFVGRFDFLKGGHLLLEALPQVAARLNKPIHLRMVGSGPSSPAWKNLAQKIAGENIRVEFPGWVAHEKKDALLAQSDLIVVPSIWPEPFGQVGLEANQLGVPAVAFDVGGISNWLRDGINGHLTAANPPSGASLADAIVKSLGNSDHYDKLRAGAKTIAAEFTIDRHVNALMNLFETVLRRRR
jgi:glycosyltransferase involved in cell wall biosynthesis